MHTKILPITCCDNIFLTKYDEQLHIQNHHPNDNINDKQDIKPIKIENMGLEVKPEVLNSKNPPENDNEDEIQLSPKRFEELIRFDNEDFDLDYEDVDPFEITEVGI